MARTIGHLKRFPRWEYPCTVALDPRYTRFIFSTDMTAQMSLARGRLFVQRMLFITSMILLICATITMTKFPLDKDATKQFHLNNANDPSGGLLVILSATTCILSVVSLFAIPDESSILQSAPIAVLRGADSLPLLAASIYVFQFQIRLLKAYPIGFWTHPVLITTLVLMVFGAPLLSILSLAKCFLIGETIYSRRPSQTWRSIFGLWSFGDQHRSLIFGTRGFEPKALGLSRGILALILCGILIMRVFTDVVVGGFREIGATPVQSIFVRSFDPFQNSHVTAPIWSIQVEILNASLPSQAMLGHAVNVTPLWDVERLSRYVHVSTVDLPSCQQGAERTTEEPFPVRLVTFFCPNFYRQNDLTVADWVDTPSMFNSPTLLVSINYDLLNISRSFFSLDDNTVNVALATTNDTAMVRRASQFFPVVSGTHSLAGVRYYSVRSFAKAHAISLGIYSYQHFFATELSVIGVDPFAVVGPNDNTASLRIFTRYDPTDWIIDQDDRQYSLLNAIATLGGMWTSFDSVFKLLFGGGMLVLLGSKPLSVFGLAHKFCTAKIRERLRRQLEDPAGRPPVFAAQNPPAALAFMDRFLVDFDILGPGAPASGDGGGAQPASALEGQQRTSEGVGEGEKALPLA